MFTSKLARVPSFLAALTLAACGGGGVLAVLGFIGSAGGLWQQDGDPAQPGLQVLDTCGQFGNERCGVSVQPVGAGGAPLFSAAYDVTYNFATLRGCPVSGQGRADGRRLVLNGCFSGEFVTLNELLSDDGKTRMFLDFTPLLAGGVWVEIQGGQRRFAFTNNTSGCELTSPRLRVTVVLRESNVTDPAGPFETTIQTFAIGNDTPWSGKFVGISGMRLTRGSEMMELERRPGNEAC